MHFFSSQTVVFVYIPSITKNFYYISIATSLKTNLNNLLLALLLEILNKNCSRKLKIVLYLIIRGLFLEVAVHECSTG